MKCEAGSGERVSEDRVAGLEFRARSKKMTMCMSGVFGLKLDRAASFEKAYVMLPCIINPGHFK